MWNELIFKGGKILGKNLKKEVGVRKREKIKNKRDTKREDNEGESHTQFLYFQLDFIYFKCFIK